MILCLSLKDEGKLEKGLVFTYILSLICFQNLEESTVNVNYIWRCILFSPFGGYIPPPNQVPSLMCTYKGMNELTKIKHRKKILVILIMEISKSAKYCTS